MVSINKCPAFPRLNDKNNRITSPKKSRYNCIAWAGGSTTKWYWPSPAPNSRSYWPPQVLRECSVRAFVQLFRTISYEVCCDGSLETGYEKIALFANNNGNPTHAARQLSDGTWTSKLGEEVDIVHRHPCDLNGRVYGKPVRYMKRPSHKAIEFL